VDVGDEVFVGLGDNVAECVGTASLITTPLFHTIFFPFFIQVNFLFW
jgi:hypothetical protein